MVTEETRKIGQVLRDNNKQEKRSNKKQKATTKTQQETTRNES